MLDPKSPIIIGVAVLLIVGLVWALLIGLF